VWRKIIFDIYFTEFGAAFDNCYWPLHNESIERCKHHMQEKLVYCCTYLENLWFKIEVVPFIINFSTDLTTVVKFVSFGGILFQQVVGIPMGTNCAPLLADLFLYSYQSEFLQKLVKDKKIHEARAFNFTYKYIDDVLSINQQCFPVTFLFITYHRFVTRLPRRVPLLPTLPQHPSLPTYFFVEGWQTIQWSDDRKYNGRMTENTMAESHSTGGHFS
jgi:hypothetical protein